MFSSARSCLAVLTCLGGLALGPRALAQKTEPNHANAPQFAVPGSADSVSTGGKGGAAAAASSEKGKHARSKVSTHHRPNAPIATFPGFRLLPDGGSRIFVELSKKVSIEEHHASDRLTYTLRGAEVLARNNKNPLITTHFATPVNRARLVPAGGDLDLVIDLRQSVVPAYQVVAGDNGSARLEIDFPAGSYPLAPGQFEPPAGDQGPGDAKGTVAPTTDEPAPASAPTENHRVGPPNP